MQTPSQPLGSLFMVANDSVHGNYLIGANGISVYAKLDDPKNQPTADSSKWKPTKTATALPAQQSLIPSPDYNAQAQFNPAFLASVQRADGSQQVSYNGWPLYYYYKDQKPGDLFGDGVDHKFFVIHPNGQPSVTHNKQDNITSYQALVPVPMGNWRQNVTFDQFSDYYTLNCWLDYAQRMNISPNNEVAYLNWFNTGAPCNKTNDVYNLYNLWQVQPYSYDYDRYNYYNNWRRQYPNWNYRRNWSGRRDWSPPRGGRGGRGGGGNRGGRGRGK